MADSSAPQALTVDGLVAWLHRYAALIGEHEDELTELDAASITDVLALDAEPGDTLHVEASGPRAGEVAEALAAFALTGFGDLDGGQEG